MTIPGKLEVSADGRITGPASITYNDPFPCVNGTYGSGNMTGVVMHTMDGTYDGTISWFNNPQAQVSAHFGISKTGQIHQFGPIGKGWIAWAEMAGNTAWYSIEHEDDGDPSVPLTAAQVTASAQLVEVLSRFAGFSLAVTNSVDLEGYGTHSMGGVAWGDHPGCPGTVRAAQRHDIVVLARQIRNPYTLVEEHFILLRSATLAGLAKELNTTPEQMLSLAQQAGHRYRRAMVEYINAHDWNAKLPVPIWVWGYKKVAA